MRPEVCVKDVQSYIRARKSDGHCLNHLDHNFVGAENCAETWFEELDRATCVATSLSWLVHPPLRVNAESRIYVFQHQMSIYEH